MMWLAITESSSTSLHPWHHRQSTDGPDSEEGLENLQQHFSGHRGISSLAP